MAQACACDRCGKFYVVKNVNNQPERRFVLIDRENIPMRSLRNDLDLCDECYAELDDFMNNVTRNLQSV